jgi:hypothetical protein
MFLRNFWDVVPCRLVDSYQRFGWTSCLFCTKHGGSIFLETLVPLCQNTPRHIPEDNTFQRLVFFELRRSSCTTVVLRAGATCSAQGRIQVTHCWVTFRRQVFQVNCWLFQSRKRSDCWTNCQSRVPASLHSSRQGCQEHSEHSGTSDVKNNMKIERLAFQRENLTIPISSYVFTDNPSIETLVELYYSPEGHFAMTFSPNMY